MKKIVILFLALVSLSCESVRVNVTSKKETISDINRHSPLHFVMTEKSEESTQMRRQCKRGVVFAGLKVEEDCDSSCRFVTLASVASEVDAGLRQRSLTVSVYADRELQKRVYLATVSTTHEKSEVITELCDAAFQAYPESLTNENFNVQSRAP